MSVIKTKGENDNDDGSVVKITTIVAEESRAGCLIGITFTLYLCTGSISFNLKEVQLPLISNEECQNRSSSPHIVSTNQLCAGVDEGGKDTCQVLGPYF